MGSLRILLVDDHADSLSVLAKLLGMQGHIIRTATTFAEAVAAAEQEQCDLVVSDIGLPDRTGVELIRELRNRYFVKGIALTGHSEAHLAEDCVQAGFSKRLLKPVAFDELLKAIREVEAEKPAPQSLAE